ncbi:hypothetical protein [Actinoplanes teichomyceticus]|uniref:Helix-hairpin-helix protein n=1 Tax=Actinoplanes teichomyceticus TaxID=1867 RepID=A0A561VJ44_ACTTI|nr:hypothetical protein [Actinoplanes teichomyceticus]TWG11651.1 hypothetical protein FHX34_106381 [Actinoplanes teichomyceticus]GIF15490.1 hypothetical protein Ate01nite_55220 [Actinoplanes teichomyceticus]
MVPSPSTYPPTTRRAGWPSTWWWFLVPLCSFGLGAFAMILLGARKLRSRRNVYAGGAFLVVTLALFCGIGLTSDSDPNTEPSAAGAVFSLAYVVVVWWGGTAYTAILQHLAGKLDPPRPVAPVPPPHSPDRAVAAAARRAARRQEARNLLVSDPAMAWELRIGRPDLANRQYDDGGLVDVNHVPAQWLAYALQIPQALAEDIVRARDSAPGGLTSAEELLIHSRQLTPDQLAMIRDLLIFRPL